MKQFILDEQYMIDLPDNREYYSKPISSFENPTEEDLIEILKGPTSRSYGHKEHPEFTKFRNQMEQDGYIKTERNWSNGDRVLKPFILNDCKFRIGDTFPCAIAMGIHIKVDRKFKK